jgi:hypothetical protein
MNMATTEQVENGVVNYDGVSGMVLQSGDSGHIEVWLGVDIGPGVSVENFDSILPVIKERIESKKDFANPLKKQMNRVYLHRAHLQDALVQLFDLYGKITQPKGPKNAVWKARYAMLDSMSNKVLKMYAADLLPDEVDNYILSDAADRVTLITKLTSILAEDREDKEESVEVAAE